MRSTPYLGASLAAGQWSLTFDGAPGDAMRAVADVLYAEGIQATFFVTGNAVKAHGGVLESLKAQGHLVGNGGYAGTPLDRSLDPVTDVRKADELILPYVTGNLFLLRAPDGQLMDDTAKQLDDAGLTRYVGQIGWDVGDGMSGAVSAFQSDAACWAAGVTADACAAGFAAQAAATGRGFVRIHADAPQAAALVKALVPRLKQLSGFSGFVRLDAVPELAVALQQSGGTPGTVGGDAGCNEY